MSLKAKVEAIIYAAEEPISLEQIAGLLKADVLAEIAVTKEAAAKASAENAEEAASDGVEITTESDADSVCPEPGPLMASNGEATVDEADAVEDANETTVADAEVTEAAAEPAVAEVEAAEVESAKDAVEPAPADAEVADTAVEAEVAEAEVADATEPEAAISASDSADIAEDQTSFQEPAVETQETPAALASPASEDVSAAAAESVTSTAPAEPAASEADPTPAESATVAAPETASRKRQPKKTEAEIAEDKAVRVRLREVLVELIGDYAGDDRGIEVRQVAGGFRMSTKPEHHDLVRAFAKSLKPPIRLSLAALETLAVVAYKQPVTGPEITDIRGVESAGVLGTLLERKLITTAGRKQVIGRPMQYKTSKDFLLRFGLNDINELPSMEEFSQLASDVTAIELTPETRSATPTLFELDQEAAEEAAATEQNPAEEPTKQEPAEESATADSQPAPVEQAAETALPENTEAPSAVAATGTDEPDQALPEDESAQAAERFGQQ
jgi:segregation and condensation protein B